MSYTSCTDNTLFLLARVCPQIATLILRGCEAVSFKGMKCLCHSGNLLLENLDIVDTAVFYCGLSIVIKGIPSLQCLRYNNLGEGFYYIHEDEYISGTYRHIKYNLTELRYEGADICENTAEVISMWTIMCPNVKKVHFLCPVSNDVLHLCTKFQHLEELRIKTTFKQKYMMSTIDVITPILPIASKLKTLILSCGKVHVPTLVENFVNLRCLFLNTVQFTDFTLEDIKVTKTKLDTLIIKDNNFELASATTKAIAVLISLSKDATNLKLNCTGAVPETIFDIILNSMKNLVFVDLSYCNVKMDCIVKFFEVPSMRQIYLDLCNSCFSFQQYGALKDVHRKSSPCTVSWRTMNDNPDDSDSDVLSDG